MVESSGLLNRRRGLNLYRGFESPPLRQRIFITYNVQITHSAGHPREMPM